MNKKEFKAKAYPIILEALLRATNGDNVQILARSVEELHEVMFMIKKLVSQVDYFTLGYTKIALKNNAVICAQLNPTDGYNHTLEII